MTLEPSFSGHPVCIIDNTKVASHLLSKVIGNDNDKKLYYTLLILFSFHLIH